MPDLAWRTLPLVLPQGLLGSHPWWRTEGTVVAMEAVMDPEVEKAEVKVVAVLVAVARAGVG